MNSQQEARAAQKAAARTARKFAQLDNRVIESPEGRYVEAVGGTWFFSNNERPVFIPDNSPEGQI